MLISGVFCTFAAAKARSLSPNPLIVLTFMKLEICGYIVATLGQLAETYPSHELKCSTTKAINGHCQVEVTTSEMRDLGFCPSFLLSKLQPIADTWGVLFWIESDHDTGVLTAYIS